LWAGQFIHLPVLKTVPQGLIFILLHHQATSNTKTSSTEPAPECPEIYILSEILRNKGVGGVAQL
jgi:hypothetical protein